MQLLLILLIVLAWWRIEFRPNHYSFGIGSLMLGCAIFGFGVVNLNDYDKILNGSLVAVGLFIALIGTARYIKHEIRNEIR